MSVGVFRRTTHEASLRVGGAAAFLTVLRDFGVDPTEVLTEVGIDPELFEDPDNLITFRARSRFIARCVARTGCPHFGLLGGQLMDLRSLGLVGLIAKNSTDVRAALQGLVNFLRLHSTGAAIGLTDDGNVAALTYDVVQSNSEATDQIGDAAVAMMYNIMRSLCGNGFRLSGAQFAHRRPKDVRPFSRFFRGPLTFDAENYSLLFPSGCLDQRLPEVDETLVRLLRRKSSELMARHGDEFPDTVRSVLRTMLLAGHHSADEVAALFSIRGRTLSRRLEAHGTNFRNVVDEARFEIARQMLENSSLDVGDIAAMLGYARTSPFSRAFRRWSGTTPAAWRANHEDRA
jgi:AraC-like DNA-binding protein